MKNITVDVSGKPYTWAARGIGPSGTAARFLGDKLISTTQATSYINAPQLAVVVRRNGNGTADRLQVDVIVPIGSENDNTKIVAKATMQCSIVIPDQAPISDRSTLAEALLETLSSKDIINAIASGVMLS